MDPLCPENYELLRTTAPGPAALRDAVGGATDREPGSPAASHMAAEPSPSPTTCMTELKHPPSRQSASELVVPCMIDIWTGVQPYYLYEQTDCNRSHNFRGQTCPEEGLQATYFGSGTHNDADTSCRHTEDLMSQLELLWEILLSLSSGCFENWLLNYMARQYRRKPACFA